jgi:uncharacterized protein (TIRG00374 family)
VPCLVVLLTVRRAGVVLGKFFKRTVLGLGIGAFFIWLSAREWPLGKVLGPISFDDGLLVVGSPDIRGVIEGTIDAQSGTDGWLMDLGLVGIYLLVLSVIHLLRVIRWKPLLDPIVELDFWTHNRIGAVGFMAMFLFPLRLGELVRPYLVKQHTGRTRISQVLPSVAVERVADGLVVSLILMATLFALPATDRATAMRLGVGAIAALGVFVGVALLLVAARWQHKRTIRIVEVTIGRVSNRLMSKVIDVLDAFLGGLQALPSVKSFLWFLLLTLIYWLINGLGVWLMAQAFFLDVDVVGGYAMMACVVVGMMVPNSPGNIGSIWYFLLLPLPLYAIPSSSVQAIAFGLMFWLVQLLQQSAFGLWFILKGDVTWSRVLEATRDDALAFPNDTKQYLL